MKYRKGTLEAKLDELLPDWPQFDASGIGLTHDGQGWSFNDYVYMGKKLDRAETISILRSRFEVHKANYNSRAKVSELSNELEEDDLVILEVSGLPFAELRR